ncbi:MoaD/ThiS family protein [Zhaonella formicivorans]|uniref:MoaD/ThiS family protein n=1 Tax=Zhaonella formicivorans TaxID=2528593 RepID=UPI001D10DEF8|nr:MoaD/ThiS family protein [Zhaonella formicivorans]
MQVHVKYFNILQEVTGKKEEILDVEDNADLAALIALIAGKYGESEMAFFDREKRSLAAHIRVFVDKKLVYNPEYKLYEGAQVALFFAVVGG